MSSPEDNMSSPEAACSKSVVDVWGAVIQCRALHETSVQSFNFLFVQKALTLAARTVFRARLIACELSTHPPPPHHPTIARTRCLQSVTICRTLVKQCSPSSSSTIFPPSLTCDDLTAAAPTYGASTLCATQGSGCTSRYVPPPRLPRPPPASSSLFGAYLRSLSQSCLQSLVTCLTGGLVV